MISINLKSLTVAVAGCGVLAGCTRETPTPTVQDYLDDKILLDAAMARCSAYRTELKYAADCVVAREASNRIARAEEEDRRRQFEAQSERKRAALRRAQEAADEARRRAAEAEQQREEADYLALFEPVDPDEPGATSNTDMPPAGSPDTTEPGGAAPESPVGDLDAIREELRRRNDGT